SPDDANLRRSGTAAATTPPAPAATSRELRSLWLRFFSMRDQALSRFRVILRSSRFSFGSAVSLLTAARKPIRRAARRRAMTPWPAAESTSLRNFLSLASAVAHSVALAAFSFSIWVFVRPNTNRPFLAVSTYVYLGSPGPNAPRGTLSSPRGRPLTLASQTRDTKATVSDTRRSGAAARKGANPLPRR